MARKAPGQVVECKRKRVRVFALKFEQDVLVGTGSSRGEIGFSRVGALDSEEERDLIEPQPGAREFDDHALQTALKTSRGA